MGRDGVKGGMKIKKKREKKRKKRRKRGQKKEWLRVALVKKKKSPNKVQLATITWAANEAWPMAEMRSLSPF